LMKRYEAPQSADNVPSSIHERRDIGLQHCT
jgi:hypothetical protein